MTIILSEKIIKQNITELLLNIKEAYTYGVSSLKKPYSYDSHLFLKLMLMSNKCKYFYNYVDLFFSVTFVSDFKKWYLKEKTNFGIIF